MLKGEAGFELFQTFYRGGEIRNNKKERTVCSFFICKIITWQELGDGNITFTDELDFEISELNMIYEDSGKAEK